MLSAFDCFDKCVIDNKTKNIYEYLLLHTIRSLHLKENILIWLVNLIF